MLEKIRVFLESNIPFDKYSKFKLKNSSCISIGTSPLRVLTRSGTSPPRASSGKENSKPFVRLTIRNTNILNNYLIPYLNNFKFISKKGKDLEDFKIISNSLYNGTHIIDEIKDLIIKLSYTMNNYRLSSSITYLDPTLEEGRRHRLRLSTKKYKGFLRE